MLQRALGSLGLVQTLYRSRRGGRVAGGKWALSEEEARFTSAVGAMANALRRGFEHGRLITERQRGEEWVADELPVFEGLRERPNPLNALSDIITESEVDAALHGTGYVEMVRDGRGMVGGLWYAPAVHVGVEYAPGGTELLRYRIGGRPHRGSRPVDPDDVIRIQRGIAPNSPAEGSSPLELLGDVASADAKLVRTATAALKNAAAATVIIPSADQLGTWDQPATDAMSRNIALRAGEDNYGGVVAVPNRLEVVPMDANIRNLALEGLAMLIEARISAVVGIPPSVAGLLVGTRYSRAKAELEEARKVMFEMALQPHRDRGGRRLDAAPAPRARRRRRLAVRHRLGHPPGGRGGTAGARGTDAGTAQGWRGRRGAGRGSCRH